MDGAKENSHNEKIKDSLWCFRQHGSLNKVPVTLCLFAKDIKSNGDFAVTLAVEPDDLSVQQVSVAGTLPVVGSH